ncbi:hypothetical protein BC834DRAFT_967296 [Gloeopeniophorella convolvens]|nr:hypothetical protein BC834DRAFT_967296 [Gloeopeniophorella convolvens]
MSLLKLPILVSAMISSLIAVTPPRLPPNKEEQGRTIGGKKRVGFVERIVQSVVHVFRTVITSVLFLEIVASIAKSHPTNLMSRQVQAMLFFGRTEVAHNWISPQFLAGIALALSGAIIRMRCYRELGRLFTYELAIRDKHTLITSGPYSIVRHPSYTGMMMVSIGLTLAETSPGTWWTEAEVVRTAFGRIITIIWILIVSYSTRLCMRGPKEDVLLRKTFADEWEEYAKKVPYLYVPGIF